MQREADELTDKLRNEFAAKTRALADKAGQLEEAATLDKFKHVTAQAASVLVHAAGLDITDPHGAETPARFVKMLRELTTPEEFKFTTFPTMSDNMVMLKDIPFASVCSHHVIPFVGYAHIAYVPDGELAGLSKFARLVKYHSRKLQVQENLTADIASSIEEHLHPKGVAVIMEAEHLCFDDRTEILTDEGWVHFKHLQRDQRVCQVDPSTNKASFVQPTEYIEYFYSGPMMSGESLKTSTLVTPDHRVVHKSGYGSGDRHHSKREWQIKPASEVWPRKLGVVLPRAATFDNGANNDLDWARFLGIWMAEGSTHQSKGSSYHVVVTQNPGTTADEIKALFDRLPYDYYVGRTTSGCLQFHITNKELYDKMSAFKGSIDRQPPREVLNMTTQCIEEFLAWHYKGDGNNLHKASDECHYTSSKALADFIQECLLRVGRTGNVRSRMSDGKVRYYIRPSNIPTTTLQAKDRTIVEYSGMVYCVSVPTGAIMVRRNGTPLVSGNCMTIRGAQSPGTKTRTAEMRGVFADHNRTAKAEFLSYVNGGK